MSDEVTRLKGINNVGDSTLSTLIQDSLVEFFDWGLLDKGNFFNIDIPASGHYGGDKHKLRLVNDPNYTSGQVWEGFRSNWVWQSGLSFNKQANVIQKELEDATYPLSKRLPGVSGVFIDNVFRPASGVGPHAHSIDHPRGRVIFDSAISTTSDVQAEFSYKWINVIRANHAFFREIQYRSQRADGDFTQAGSGDWSQLSENRLQLPVLAIEGVKKRDFKPYQLGGGQWVYSDVLFHVLAEEEYTRDKILDIVSLQNEKTLRMFDSDRIGRNNAYPLDWKGSPKSGSLRYPEMIAYSGVGGYGAIDIGIAYGALGLRDSRITAVDTLSPNLYHGVVRTSTEVIMPQI